MTTPTDLITDALTKLGVYSPGEPIAAADMAQGLIRLNDMLDHWADDNLYVFQLSAIAVSVTSGGSTYNIPAPRPPRLLNGPGRASVLVGSSTTPVNVVSQVEFSVIQGGYTSTGTPDTVYYDPQYPAGILNVRPIPGTSGTLTVQGWTPLIQFTGLTQNVTLAEGVEDTLKSNLAVALKPYFNNVAIDPVIVSEAADSLTTLRQYAQTSRAMIRRQRERRPNASGP